MKIELISEEAFGKDPFYEVRVDGHFITGSSKLETAESLYNQLLSNPDALKTQKIVLKFAEIDVTSQS
jgi:hypothetical protein